MQLYGENKKEREVIYMFDFLKRKGISKEDIAKMLKTTPDALKDFEDAYKTYALSDTISDNLFEINAKQAALMNEGVISDNPEIESIIQRIVNELIAQTAVWKYDGKKGEMKTSLVDKPNNPVSLDEINALPEHIRPQLTGTLMKRDIGEPSYFILLDNYRHYLNEKNIEKRRHWYHLFRQGLDILDLDPITYEIIGTNPNSMGYWLPVIIDAITEQGFFKIPKTTIIKVPLTMLQLTRNEYTQLTRTTLDIIDEFCKKVFGLDENKEYFIKTGTYSSKFDFRNACLKGAKEVRELGEYLLFIHFQACMMASPLNNRTVYGVSTTNEWVVREFIPDREENPCIYKGLPLHTEYRVFVDFDTKQVIGINPYWDPDVMKQRFGHEEDADNPHNKHDYITYLMHEDVLMNRYNENKETVLNHVNEFIQNVDGLTGQWSVDIMQNGDEFWLIDMAMAQNSALIECVPKELRRKSEENWLPEIKELINN